MGINVIDPLLVQAADGLWRPATNSPVVGAAMEVGADEVPMTPPLLTPVGPEDVGPRWMIQTPASD